MNYNKIFIKINKELNKTEDLGEVATYIPELGNVDPTKFGAHLTTINQQYYQFGDDWKFFLSSVLPKFWRWCWRINRKVKNYGKGLV